MQPPVHIFCQCGTAFHPVTDILVDYAPDIFACSLVNMAADISVNIFLPGRGGNFVFITTDKIDNILDPGLQIGGNGPVWKAQKCPQGVEEEICFKEHFVRRTSQEGKPPVLLHNAVKLVAMGYQELLASCRDMDRLLDYGHAMEMSPGILPQNIVMVARDVDDLGTLPGFFQNRADNMIVDLRPVPGFAQFPEIDDIADQIEIIGMSLFQEIEEIFSVGMPGSQVNIGNPDRSKIQAVHVTSFFMVVSIIKKEVCYGTVQMKLTGVLFFVKEK